MTVLAPCPHCGREIKSTSDNFEVVAGDEPQKSPMVSPSETFPKSAASSKQTQRRKNSWLFWGCGCVMLSVSSICAFSLVALAINQRDNLRELIKAVRAAVSDMPPEIKAERAAVPDMPPEIKAIINHAENVRLSFYGFYLGMSEEEVKALETYYWPDNAQYNLPPCVSYSISPETKRVYRLQMYFPAVSKLANGGESFLELKAAVEKHMNIAMVQASYATVRDPRLVEVLRESGRAIDGFMHNDDGSLMTKINGYEYQTIHQTTVFITDHPGPTGSLIIEDWGEREILDEKYGYGNGDGQLHLRVRKLSGPGELDL